MYLTLHTTCLVSKLLYCQNLVHAIDFIHSIYRNKPVYFLLLHCVWVSHKTPSECFHVECRLYVFNLQSPQGRIQDFAPGGGGEIYNLYLNRAVRFYYRAKRENFFGVRPPINIIRIITFGKKHIKKVVRTTKKKRKKIL